MFATRGDAQAEQVVWRAEVAAADNATDYQLYIDGVAEQFVIPENSVVSFNINIAIVEEGTEQVGSADVQGTVKRTGGVGTVTLVGTRSRNTYEDAGGFDCDVTVDTGTGALYPYVRCNTNLQNIKAIATGVFVFMKYA
jgi:hypothetical protein